MKKNFIKSTLILSAGTLLSRLIGFFFKVPLAYYLGSEGMAYYSLAYTSFGLFIAIYAGLPTAIASIVAGDLAVGRVENVHSMLKITLKWMIILSAVISILLIGISPMMIRWFSWPKETYLALIALCSGIAILSVVAILKGYFIGIQKNEVNAISLIAEAATRLLLGLGLMFLLIPRGSAQAVGGAAFGTTLGGIAAILVFVHYYRKFGPKKLSTSVERQHDVDSERGQVLRVIRISVPITLGALAGTLMSLSDAILVNSRLMYAGFSMMEATHLYGALAAAIMMINFPMALCYPLAISTVPVAAEMRSGKDMAKLHTFLSQLSYLILGIALPIATGMAILSTPIMDWVFPSIEGAGNLLKFSTFFMFAVLLNQVVVSVLQGLGNVKAPLYSLCTGALVKITISFCLLGIRSINIYGAVIGTAVGYFVILLLNMHQVKKMTGFRLKLDPKLMFIVGINVLMGLSAYVLYYVFFKSHTTLSLLLAIGVAGSIYCIAAGGMLYKLSGKLSVKSILK